jgi:hypothetical protein
MKESYKKFEVKDCESLREFLEKYFRVEKIDAESIRGDVIENLIDMYNANFVKDGFIFIPAELSKTDEKVSYFFDEEKIMQERKENKGLKVSGMLFSQLRECPCINPKSTCIYHKEPGTNKCFRPEGICEKYVRWELQL